MLRICVRGVLLACVLSGVLSAGAENKPKIVRLEFRYEGRVRTCYAFAPSQQGPLPAIVLLHGSGRNGRIMVDEWKDLSAREGIVLVAPDALREMEWNLKWDSPLFLHAAVDEVNKIHPIDHSRIYVFGHSAGAEYGLILALLDSNYFAATAIHAGILPPEFNRAFNGLQRRMPVAIWVGDRDFSFPPEEVRATKRLFDDNGFHVQLTVIALHDHNYYAVAGEVNRKAWAFFKSARFEDSAQAGP